MIKLHVSSAIRSTFCWTSLLTIRYCLLLDGEFCTCEVGDDSALLGTWGFVDNCLRYGCWNMGCAYSAGWRPACRWRIAGLANVLSFLKQLDFIFVSFEFIYGKFWRHNCLNTGLDYRCAHSMLKFGWRNERKQNECLALKIGSFCRR